MADPQALPQDTIEPEADDYDDTDSALGDDNASSTTSLSSTIFRHRHENGRTYHAFKGDEQIYAFPNDEKENERMDMQHHLFNLTFQDRLFLAPIPKEKHLGRVLDIGCGTGIWAINFADAHPESEVTGVDLSPIQPDFVPPNLMFQIDDIEDSWTFSHKFDFVFCRMMVASIKDWPALFSQIYDGLNPGGYIELADICFPVACDDGTLPADSAIVRWADLILQAGVLAGRICDSPIYYKSQLEALGFVNVVEIVHKWPQNRWPKEKHFKELGMWNHANFIDGLEALSLGLFTRVLGWLPEEVIVFLVDVRKEMKNTKIHAYYPIYSVYAQKPYSKTPKPQHEVEIEYPTPNPNPNLHPYAPPPSSASPHITRTHNPPSPLPQAPASSPVPVPVSNPAPQALVPASTLAPSSTPTQAPSPQPDVRTETPATDADERSETMTGGDDKIATGGKTAEESKSKSTGGSTVPPVGGESGVSISGSGSTGRKRKNSSI